MPSCVLRYCTNYTKKISKNQGITYHSFPVDPELASYWVNVVRKSRKEEFWKPNKFSVICSDHFYPKDLYTTGKGYRRLSKGALPRKALFISSFESDEREQSDSNIETSTVTETELTIKKSPDSYAENEALKSESAEDRVVYLKQEKPFFPEGNSIVEICKANKDEDAIEDFSDLDSVFDTPTESKIRNELRRRIILQKKHMRIIRSLKRKNLSLTKKNSMLKEIVHTLKTQRCTCTNNDDDTHNILNEKE